MDVRYMRASNKVDTNLGKIFILFGMKMEYNVSTKLSNVYIYTIFVVYSFSFDCHDPAVFSTSTVTGLLEHYKDPGSVMFFEPMLTVPFHRKKVFSLQQLVRAAIVSNTTYDGVSELELPVRLKSFLKEYHYKQKLRVKLLDERLLTYT